MGKVGVGVAVGVAVVACAVAGVVVGRKLISRRKWSKVMGIVKEFEDASGTPISRLRMVVDALAVEMHAGLASEGGSKLKMLLSFVERLPTGSEIGTCYALDLGSTNFRMLRVQLGGWPSTLVWDVERQDIPDNLVNTTTEELFDYVATALNRFVEGTKDPVEVRRDLGLTFSYPVKQTSVNSGKLLKWPKGFSGNLVGKDVGECLQMALSKQKLNMRVAALVNDTVGALALGHYHDADTVAAVIIGNGTNACYIERADAIIKCQGLLTPSSGSVVNIEWGSFWSSHLPRTSYDVELDVESLNPNEQCFEKMISGCYLGDIVRRVMLRMCQESDLFGPVTSKLTVPFSLQSHLVLEMQEDTSSDFIEVAQILSEHLEILEVSLKARQLVAIVCDIVTRRAARLAAAGIASILKKIGRDGSGGSRNRGEAATMKRTVVAIEGDLYTNYTMFREYMQEALHEILGEEVAEHVILKVTVDGSGVGAALLAATYTTAASSVD